jgi:cell division protein FtsB
MKDSVSIFLRLVLLLLLLLSGWLYMLSQKERVRDKTIGSEISRLEMEAEKMRADTLSLKERIAYFSSDAFQEREAKEKLDFRKQDEKVIVVRPGREGVSGGAPLLSSVESGYNDEDMPNHRKWWRLFWE